jgi:hypothetical protein
MRVILVNMRNNLNKNICTYVWDEFQLNIQWGHKAKPPSGSFFNLVTLSVEIYFKYVYCPKVFQFFLYTGDEVG